MSSLLCLGPLLPILVVETALFLFLCSQAARAWRINARSEKLWLPNALMQGGTAASGILLSLTAWFGFIVLVEGFFNLDFGIEFFKAFAVFFLATGAGFITAIWLEPWLRPIQTGDKAIAIEVLLSKQDVKVRILPMMARAYKATKIGIAKLPSFKFGKGQIIDLLWLLIPGLGGMLLYEQAMKFYGRVYWNREIKIWGKD